MFKNIKTLFKYRELLLNITLRQIKVRYKQSVLGILWAIIRPFSTMIIFTLIFSKFAKIPSDGIPYPIFSYIALLPWVFFSSSLSNALSSLVNNSNLLSKIYFPREIFPISSLLVAFIDFIIATLVFIIMMFWFKVDVSLNILFTIPILFIQTLFTLGIALFVSALNVYYRDVEHVFPLVIQLWMFLCPIIYPVSLVPDRLRTIYMLNPMSPIIDGYRRVLIQGRPPDFYYLAIAMLVSIIIFLLSFQYFKKIEMTFVDVI